MSMEQPSVGLRGQSLALGDQGAYRTGDGHTRIVLARGAAVLNVTCPYCNQRIRVKGDPRGRQIKCPMCGQLCMAEPNLDSSPVPSPAEPSGKRVRMTPPAGGTMLVSSGDANRPFVALGLVVGFASESEGCSGGINVEGVYEAALKRLTESATARGATGLLFVNFQNRMATAAGCTGPKQAFEVFAWGTAVRWVQDDE